MIKSKGITAMGCFALIAVLVAQAAAGQAGVTEAVFNRRFLPSIKPGMTYEQITKLAGGPGLKIAENQKAGPLAVQYRWKGGRNSVMTVNFTGNKMTDATILAPNKHTYLIKSSGEVVDITK